MQSTLQYCETISKSAQMKNNILKKIKPITKLMEEDLMEYHERELLNMEPTLAYYTRSSRGLFHRGLIGAKNYTKDNKTYTIFHITSLGIYYLSKKL